MNSHQRRIRRRAVDRFREAMERFVDATLPTLFRERHPEIIAAWESQRDMWRKMEADGMTPTGRLITNEPRKEHRL